MRQLFQKDKRIQDLWEALSAINVPCLTFELDHKRTGIFVSFLILDLRLFLLILEEVSYVLNPF